MAAESIISRLTQLGNAAKNVSIRSLLPEVPDGSESSNSVNNERKLV